MINCSFPYSICISYRDIEASTSIIEQLKGGARGGGGKSGGVDPLQKSILQLRAELQESQRRRKELEEDLRDARENAEEKAEELSQLIAQTREYEAGRERPTFSRSLFPSLNFPFFPFHPLPPSIGRRKRVQNEPIKPAWM